VVVVAANDGLFPHRLSEDVEEERARLPRRDHPVPAPAGGHDGGVGGRPRRPQPTTGGTPDDGHPEPDDALFDALRAWRSRVASTNGVPAYLVFHDRHLQVLAGRKPSTLIELAGCPGVGPAKLERYGDDLLDLIADHLG
jgi:DNA helicase II / ATP-dependent DNA helicase PcrA